MIVDCAYYQDGRRQGEGAVSLEEAAARCGQGGFVWLGLFEPGDEEPQWRLAPSVYGPVAT
jgi:magnesium transporter